MWTTNPRGRTTVLLAPLQPTDDAETVRKKIAATATYLEHLAHAPHWKLHPRRLFVDLYAMYLVCRACPPEI